MTVAGKPAARLRKAAVQPKSNQTALEQESGCSKRQSSRKMEVVDYLLVLGILAQTVVVLKETQRT